MKQELISILMEYIKMATRPEAAYEDKNNIPSVARIMADLIDAIPEEPNDSRDYSASI